jgi:transketolase
VAEVVVQSAPTKIAFVGLQDTFGESGKPAELLAKYGLTASDIIAAVKSL